MPLNYAWITELDRNARGRPFLTGSMARKLARDAAAGKWYTALYAMRWTVGKVGNSEFSSFHVLDESGEPLSFDSELEAWQYLRCDLNVPPHSIMLLERAREAA
jgi:hypothetical protein